MAAITVPTTDSFEQWRVKTNQIAAQTETNTNSILGIGGGSVVQNTNKSTAVTLNTLRGRITMTNSLLAAGATVHFTLNNSSIDDSDAVFVVPAGGFAVDGDYSIRIGNVQNGAVSIFVKNESVGGLSEAVRINFAVIKGTTS